MTESNKSSNQWDTRARIDAWLNGCRRDGNIGTSERIDFELVKEALTEIDRLAKEAKRWEKAYDQAWAQVQDREQLRQALLRIDELMIRERQSNKGYVREVRRITRGAFTRQPVETTDCLSPSGHTWVSVNAVMDQCQVCRVLSPRKAQIGEGGV